MWPFRRRAEAAPAGGPQPVPAPVIRRDWVGLPPIQRLIRAHPLTAPSDRFSDDLATHHDPSVSSDTMGHQVSAEAPAGLVLALARPTTRSDGPAMIPRPRVQRRETGAVAVSGEWDGDAAAPETTRPTPFPASGPAVIERPVVTPIADQPLLTALAPDVDPVPVMSKPRHAAAPMSFDLPADRASDASDLPGSQPAPRLTLGQARRLGLGAPINKLPDRSVQRSGVEPTGLLQTATTTPPPPLRPSIGDTMSQSPAPEQAAAPEAAAVSLQRTALESNAAPVPTLPAGARSLPLAPMRSVSASPGTPTLTDTEQPALLSPLLPESSAGISSIASPAGAPSADQLTVQALPQRASQPEPHSNPPSSAESLEAPVNVGIRDATALPLRPLPVSHAPGSTPATTVIAPAARAVAPLVGVRPIATLQRSTEDAAPVADRRSAAAIADETGDGDGRIDFAKNDEPTGSELVSFDGELRQSATSPAIQRLVDETTVERRTATLTLPPRPRDTLAGLDDERPARVETAGADLPLAPTPVIIQRIAADESSGRTAWATLTAGPSVQREPAEAVAIGEAPGASSAGPGGAASPNGSSFHASADSPMAPAAMDALAGKLYDRIRSRLKTELLVDRERAGFLTDLR
jgi:hypothetical protein